MDRKKLSLFLIVFSAILLINSFFANKDQSKEQVLPDFEFASISDTYHPGDKVILNLTNNSKAVIRIKNDCPEEPLEVYRKEGAEWKHLTYRAEENALLECPTDEFIELAPQQKYSINYAAWNQGLFQEIAQYKVEAIIETDDKKDKDPNIGPVSANTRTLISEFTIEKRGIFRSFGLFVFYKPLLNFLVFLTKVLPTHNLAWAIILLTIIVRLLLFIPTYRSLEQQKSMQELQPKLQALKEKYKGNQQKLGEETMKLYKEHGVNPFGSCLPILIQMPFLFAIFRILRQGLDASTGFLLYTPLRDFPIETIDVSFLGFDLSTVPSDIGMRIIPPLLVGGAQFLTMKLTQAKQKKKIHDITPREKNEPKPMKEMEKATGMMMYMMPIMIAFFAYSYPVGLSLYWFCSTIFAIGQQLVLNKKRALLNSGSKK